MARLITSINFLKYYELLSINFIVTVVPLPTLDWMDISPLYISTIRLHVANPSPVPSYLDRLCNFLNFRKI